MPSRYLHDDGCLVMLGRMVRRLAMLVLCTILAFAACAKPVEEQAYLQASDLVAETTGFDPGEIVDTPSFVDAQGVDGTQVQQLLDRTPYGHPSFLATYSSNGVRADDAVIRAALKYQLNPLVFLVEAEVRQGLVGAEFYPPPPARVEYVFDCGCAAAGDCDPSLAGFDVQVDCLGRQLRASLDAVAAGGTTLGGWGPNASSITADGVLVTPADASTAALYQYLPSVAVNKAGGNWLVWNVWQIYATAANYFGPVGNPGGPMAWVGDACNADPACTYLRGICATNYPGGMCTAQCAAQTDCPSDAMHPATFCADFQQSGYCLVACDPTVAASCRSGYTCKSVQGYMMSGTAQNVCVNM